MDAGQLHRLGRRLIELSAQVTGDPDDLPLTPGETAVLEDVIKHPDSSIGEIHRRTGFVQSHVSASVARLRDKGLLDTTADAGDGRRTRVRVTPGVARAITRRAARRVDRVIGRRATELLDELAVLLL